MIKAEKNTDLQVHTDLFLSTVSDELGKIPDIYKTEILIHTDLFLSTVSDELGKIPDIHKTEILTWCKFAFEQGHVFGYSLAMNSNKQDT